MPMAEPRRLQANPGNRREWWPQVYERQYRSQQISTPCRSWLAECIRHQYERRGVSGDRTRKSSGLAMIRCLQLAKADQPCRSEANPPAYRAGTEAEELARPHRRPHTKLKPT